MNKQGILQYGRLLCCILMLFLSFCLSAEPQEEARITLDFKSARLETVIDAIREQSPYLFMNNGVDQTQTVTISISDASIENVCERLFPPIGVIYEINGRYITISKSEPVTVSGTAKDAAGLPVPGAAVFETGTTNGTTTDIDGNYSLTVTGGGQLNGDKLPRIRDADRSGRRSRTHRHNTA